MLVQQAILPLLLSTAAASASVSSQIPLGEVSVGEKESNPNDTEPDVSPFVFTSLQGLMRQWQNVFAPTGHTIIPGTIPAHTLLYHARRDMETPPSPEWFAFDIEMSYGIIAPFGDCIMNTYTSTRPIKVLYFDGMSAALGGEGTLDSQNVFLYGKVVDDDWGHRMEGDEHGPGGPGSPGRPGGPLYGEYKRAKELCKWANSLGEGVVEGFVRMNSGFELLWCDFESESIELVSRLNVTVPTSEKVTEIFEFEEDFEEFEEEFEEFEEVSEEFDDSESEYEHHCPPPPPDHCPPPHKHEGDHHHNSPPPDQEGAPPRDGHRRPPPRGEHPPPPDCHHEPRKGDHPPPPKGGRRRPPPGDGHPPPECHHPPPRGGHGPPKGEHPPPPDCHRGPPRGEHPPPPPECHPPPPPRHGKRPPKGECPPPPPPGCHHGPPRGDHPPPDHHGGHGPDRCPPPPHCPHGDHPPHGPPKGNCSHPPPPGCHHPHGPPPKGNCSHPLPPGCHHPHGPPPRRDWKSIIRKFLGRFLPGHGHHGSHGHHSPCKHPHKGKHPHPPCHRPPPGGHHPPPGHGGGRPGCHHPPPHHCHPPPPHHCPPPDGEPPNGSHPHHPPGQRSPFAIESRWEWVRSATWHYTSPEDRVKLDYCRMTSYYNVSHPSGVKRSHRLTAITPEQAEAVKTEVVNNLLSEDVYCTGTDWREVADGVARRYLERVMELQELLRMRPTPETVKRVRGLSHAIAMPFLQVSDESTEAAMERCVKEYTGRIDLSRIGNSERMLVGAVEGVMQGICELAFGVYEDFSGPIDKEIVVNARENIEELVARVDWAGWHRCEESCGWNEVCAVPLWPILGTPWRRGADDELLTRPRCVSIEFMETGNGGWGPGRPRD